MRKTIAAIAAAGVAVLVVRTLHNRRSADEPDPREEARAEATEASEHATAAFTHARRAGGHAVEYARGEIESTDAPDSTSESTSRPRVVQRFR